LNIKLLSNTVQCQLQVVNVCCHIKPLTKTGEKHCHSSCKWKPFKWVSQSFNNGK